MARSYLKRVEGAQFKMDLVKKLRVRVAATFRIWSHRVLKRYVLSNFISSTTCLMKLNDIGPRQTAYFHSSLNRSHFPESAFIKLKYFFSLVCLDGNNRQEWILGISGKDP